MASRGGGAWYGWILRVGVVLAWVDGVQASVTIEPLHRISFAEAPDVARAIFAPNGETLYVQLCGVKMLDVWGLLVNFWPELTGGLISLVVIAMTAWMIRVVKRRRHPGGMYCRGCNYDVTSLVAAHTASAGESAGAKCPECGRLVRGKTIVRGRSLARRVAIPAALCVLLIGTWGAAVGLGVARSGRANGWLIWHSERLYLQTVDMKIGAWLKPFVVGDEKIVEVEFATGRVLRTVCTRPNYMGIPLAMSPDGSAIFVSGGNDAIDCVSTRTGRVARTLKRDHIGFQLASHGQGSIVLFGRNSTIAYVVWADYSDERGHLLKWDLGSGEVREVLNEEAYGWEPTKGPKAVAARSVVVFDQDGQTMAITGPQNFPHLNEMPDSFRVYQIGVQTVKLRELGVTRTVNATVVVHPGSHTAYLPSYDGIASINLDRGEWGARASPPGWDEGDTSLAMDPSGGYLLWPARRAGVLVIDSKTGTLCARLNVPDGFIRPVPTASPAQGRVVVNAFRSSNGKYVHELMLYDVSAVADGSGAGGAGEENERR